MTLKLLDCTLRDGANVVGGGFDAATTSAVIGALVDARVSAIEYGHPSGIGGNEGSAKKAPLSDDEYLALAVPFLGRGTEIGMFAQPKWSTEPILRKAAKTGLNFVRVGCNAGSGKAAEGTIKAARGLGLTVRFSMMKCYVLSPRELAEEALMLQSFGAQSITLMDSAGTMTPNMVRNYVFTVAEALDVPTGFHGHNNLGLSIANSLAAAESGARELDACLMGMARSAGNCATELIAAVLQRQGRLSYVDLDTLLNFIEKELEPAMAQDYHCPVKPLDLVYGYTGCHSNFYPNLSAVAEEKNVPLFKLIAAVCTVDRKSPSVELIRQIAGTL